jgi:epoxyqueuosine reductase
MTSRSEITQFIKSEAIKSGFFNVGFSEAKKLSSEEIRLKEWLNEGQYGSMSYMENHFDKRLDPTELVDGAKSIISLLFNYYNDIELKDLKISKYALGKDYHKVIKKKLKTLYTRIKERYPETQGRYFVDSAPILERAWARESGLGWIGKNTMLINKKAGSFFFISEMILNIELEYSESLEKNHCGKCRKCIDSCPTQAIAQNGYILDANKCISYLTIENKGEISPEFDGKMSNYIFGCDICQTVCPWNNHSKVHNEQDFFPQQLLLSMDRNKWKKLDENQFSELFKSSAVNRAKFAGIKRNIDFIDK